MDDKSLLVHYEQINQLLKTGLEFSRISEKYLKRSRALNDISFYYEILRGHKDIEKLIPKTLFLHGYDPRDWNELKKETLHYIIDHLEDYDFVYDPDLANPDPDKTPAAIFMKIIQNAVMNAYIRLMIDMGDTAINLVRVGTVFMNADDVTKHCFICGAPGTGKTLLLRDIIFQYKGHHNMIIYDFKGDFTNIFYEDGLDYIFNPLDDRCLNWNIFDEIAKQTGIERETLIDSITHSLIPDINDKRDAFWREGARVILRGIINFIDQYLPDFLKNNGTVYYYLTKNYVELSVIIREVEPLSRQFLSKDMPETTQGIMAVLTQYATPFRIFAKIGFGCLEEAYTGALDKLLFERYTDWFSLKSRNDIKELETEFYNDIHNIIYHDDGSENKKNSSEKAHTDKLKYNKILDSYIRGKERFTIYDWVHGCDNPGKKSTIFITSISTQEASLKPLLSLFIELLVKETLALEENLSRRMFFILDELGTLQKLDKLISALNQGRSKGMSVYIAIQDFGQLDDIYGEHHTKSIINNCNTKCVFAVTEPRTSRFFEEMFGRSEIMQRRSTVSFSGSVGQWQVGTSIDIKEKQAVPADKISSQETYFFYFTSSITKDVVVHANIVVDAEHHKLAQLRKKEKEKYPVYVAFNYQEKEDINSLNNYLNDLSFSIIGEKIAGEQELKDKKAEKKHYEEELNSLNSDIDEYTTRIDSAKGLLADLKKEKDDKMKEHDELEKYIESIERVNAKMKAEVNNMQKGGPKKE
ncbi:MAG: type IV secretion system DNA-binding domain-containing protein [Brevinematales bacterium]|nr:type IV secretion system DNA-binding domain-containing protein [Brevinematales bacterium]